MAISYHLTRLASDGSAELSSRKSSALLRESQRVSTNSQYDDTGSIDEPETTAQTRGVGRPIKTLTTQDRRFVINELKKGTNQTVIRALLEERRYRRLNTEERNNPEVVADSRLSLAWLCKYIAAEGLKQKS